MPKRRPASSSSASSNGDYPPGTFHSYGKGIEYTDEEMEFLKAIAAHRNGVQRPITLIEGFRIAKGLGWSKT